MIKKLRIKFIAITMLSLFIVLSLIVSAINITSYRGIVNEADEILEVLKMNDGKFPAGEMRERVRPDGTETIPETPPDLNEPRPEETEGQPSVNNGAGPENGPKFRNAEIPYASRFFWVLVDPSGSVSETSTDHVVSVDQDQAEAYAREVLDSGKTSGFLGDYRYTVSEGDQGTRVIFLDCWSDRLTFRKFLLASCLISLAGMLAVFLLILFFSNRIIRPISDSYEKQKRFITDAGHEIKTPLAIIDADAEVLEMEVGEDNEWVADIRSQIKRLTGLTNDLVYLSRMEEGGRSLIKTELSLTEILEEMVQPYRAMARVQDKELQILIQQDIRFVGDEKSLRQLVSILMDNAMKYSPAGSAVSLKAEKGGRNVSMQVENEAENLKKEDIDHLFDRFYRADSSRNSEKGGHGIGLSMARAITEAHGGKIHAERVGETRLRVSVHLPVKKQNS